MITEAKPISFMPESPKPRYRLYWSLHELAWACFHHDDYVKREGAWIVGPLLAYIYEDGSVYINPNKSGRSYSQL